VLSPTLAALEAFDNQHDFERLAADVLNASGCADVVLQAPRGGADGGRDVLFSYDGGRKGLAWVTLRKDIEKKFHEDASKRSTGDFSKYYLFCTAHLTSGQKDKFTTYCRDSLNAAFIPQDSEALRSILDSRVPELRERYLRLVSNAEAARRRAILTKLRQKYMLSHDGLSPGLIAGLEPIPKAWVEGELAALGETWRQDKYL
jgi:hypothetical protein